MSSPVRGYGDKGDDFDKTSLSESEKEGSILRTYSWVKYDGNNEGLDQDLPSQEALPKEPVLPGDRNERVQGYLQVLAGFMCFLNAWGMITSFGVLQEFYYTGFLDRTNSNISWISTLQGFLLSTTAVFAGPILDSGHNRYLAVGGTFMVTLGMMMTSLCRNYWQLMLAQAICVGIGAGQLFVTAVTVLPGWYKTNLAFAAGFAGTGSSIGGVVYPIVFRNLEPTIGFGWMVRVVGFIALGTGAVAVVCTKQKTLPLPRPKIVDFSGFKERSFCLFSLASCVGSMGLYIPFFDISEYGSERGGFSGSLAFYMLPIMSDGSTLGRIVPPFIADKLGFMPVLTTTMTISGILAFCWMAVDQSEAGLIVWSLLYGTFSGTFTSLQTPTVASITKDKRIVGGRMGMNNFASAVGLLVGNPIAGALPGTAHWVGLQAFCGALLFVSAALTLVTYGVVEAKEPLRRFFCLIGFSCAFVRFDR